MKIIPAIDLKGGRCVRLREGRAEDVTVYSDDPVATARRWVEAGGELIHLVDLDGAFSGVQANLDAVRAIRAAVDVELELGGGIRDMERIDLMVSLGIDRVILGTVAAKDPDLLSAACAKYPGRIIVGIDARNGKVAVRGWVEVTELDAREFGRKVADQGAAGIIYTDISRDGMMTGPNVEATAEMARAVPVPVIASGGVTNIGDIKNLLSIEGLWGAITGKAIYAGTLDLREAIALAGGAA
jgi:phosphoribosylformimino-5-aminoimidazole carboxamide ribotide isomerase